MAIYSGIRILKYARIYYAIPDAAYNHATTKFCQDAHAWRTPPSTCQVGSGNTSALPCCIHFFPEDLNRDETLMPDALPSALEI